jgi:hypothetical protein
MGVLWICVGMLLRVESFRYNVEVGLVTLQSWLRLERPGATRDTAMIYGRAIKSGLGRRHKFEEQQHKQRESIGHRSRKCWYPRIRLVKETPSLYTRSRRGGERSLRSLVF